MSLCYRLPLKELLCEIEVQAKTAQLYVELPLVRAVVYAKNSKRSSWCGFVQNVHRKSVKRETFLAQNMLPGPSSKVICLFYPDTGPERPKNNPDQWKFEKMWLKKDNPIALVPSIAYKPGEWLSGA